MNTPQTDTETRPMMIDCEETPELAQAWRNLFSAAWDAYDRMMERRHAAVATTNNQQPTDRPRRAQRQQETTASLCDGNGEAS